jgi:hypothetical protein
VRAPKATLIGLWSAFPTLVLAQSRYQEYEDSGMPAANLSGDGSFFIVFFGLMAFGFSLTRMRDETAKVVLGILGTALLALAIFGGEGGILTSLLIAAVIFAGFLGGSQR